jgi:4-diphosphocytidyl-2-C-methyl-D-erythritol kinase
MLAALRAGDVQAVAEHLYNNLDPVARRLVPDDDVIAAWLAADGGVLGAQVSGSGSCVFAICRSHEDAGRLAGAARLRGWWSAATKML